MGICKRLWFTILVSLMIFATLPAMSMTPQQQKKMLDQLDQLDQMEKLDHFDFSDLAAKADACTHARDFNCAEKNIAKASKSISSSQDKKALQELKRNLVAERKAAEEERLAEELRLAEARRRESQSSGIQWGKLVAMGTGALIGGVGHMPAEVQNKVITGIVKDSMPGQDGMSNFKGNMDSLNAEQRARNERAAAAQRDQQAKAIAAEAANNRRLMDASIRSHQSNDQNTTNRQQTPVQPWNNQVQGASGASQQDQERQRRELQAQLAANQQGRNRNEEQLQQQTRQNGQGRNNSTTTTGGEAAGTTSTSYLTQGGLQWIQVKPGTHTYDQAYPKCGLLVQGPLGWRLPSITEVAGLTRAQVDATGSAMATGGLYGSGALTGQGWDLVKIWTSNSSAWHPKGTMGAYRHHLFVDLSNGQVGSIKVTTGLVGPVACVRLIPRS